ncbi:HNH endonuclease signature motif containing protein [Methylomagnum sp.]
MAISEITLKILWGRAGGHCSYPGCETDLIHILESNNFHIGEMAHIIAKRENGPRGIAGGGSDEYSNLILLCPTHHTLIDKSPKGIYPDELLHKWKDEAELKVHNAIKHKAPDYWQLYSLYSNIYCALFYFREFNRYGQFASAFIYGPQAEECAYNILIKASHNTLLIKAISEKIISDLEYMIASYQNLPGLDLYQSLYQSANHLLTEINYFFNKPIERKIINLARCYTDVAMYDAMGSNYTIELYNLESAASELLLYSDHALDDILKSIRRNKIYVNGNLDFEQTCNNPNTKLIGDIYGRLKYLIRIII